MLKKASLVMSIMALVLVGVLFFVEEIEPWIVKAQGSWPAESIGSYNVRSYPDAWHGGRNIQWVTRPGQKLLVTGHCHTPRQGIWVEVVSPSWGWISIRGISIKAWDFRSLPEVNPDRSYPPPYLPLITKQS